MRVYLTAHPEYRATVNDLAAWLEARGHRVSSTWHVTDVEDELAPAFGMLELDQSDAVLVYIGDDRLASMASSWEMGYGWRAGKRLFWIGRSPDMFTTRYGHVWPDTPPANLGAC